MHVYLDGEGKLTYMAGSQWRLDNTMESWKDLEFHATREHSWHTRGPEDAEENQPIRMQPVSVQVTDTPLIPVRDGFLRNPASCVKKKTLRKETI